MEISNILNELWKLRHMTVKQAIEKIQAHPNVKFLVTVYGLMVLISAIFVFLIVGNVFYLVLRMLKTF